MDDLEALQAPGEKGGIERDEEAVIPGNGMREVRGARLLQLE